MDEKQNSKDRLKEITDSIEQGIKDLFQSDKYMQYLTTMSRFHKYSVNNTMLIYMQRPDATLVAGFNKWKDQFERNVLKGEHGIKIIAPTPFKRKIEQEKLDPDTRLPMLDEDGRVITEEKTVQIPMYKVVSVFDVSQTEGKPLPTLASDLAGKVQNYEVFMEALKRSAPVPIAFEAMRGDMDGYFSTKEQRIAIREGMSEVQTVSAAVHEIAHSKLHNKDLPEIREQWKLVMVSDGGTRKDFAGGFDTLAEAEAAGEANNWQYKDENDFIWRLEVEEDTTLAEFVKKSRGTEEVEAESVSFAVCAYYGIPTGENSFGYIAGWSKDKNLPELRASLETINKTASKLITDIDQNYATIMKERDLEEAEQMAELEAVQSTKPMAEAIPVDDDKIIDVKIETYDPDNSSLLPADYPMPDPGVSIEAMNAYGYTDTDILPLSHEKAVELFEKDLTIYMLYPGNHAGMAFDRDDIDLHDGLYGIPREEWEAVRESLELSKRYEPDDMGLERSFLDNPDDVYAIYQLKHGEEMAELRFMNSKYLQKHDLQPNHDNYELIYTGLLPHDGDPANRLDELYYRFNEDRPADFTGHSLSVSDIVALKQGGAVSCHYVDSFGFRELPTFLPPENYLKSAEMSVEDDYGMIDGIINNGQKQPTVADLEEQAKSGQPISLMDLMEATRREQSKRPSVHEQLKSKPTKQSRKKKVSPRDAEMEI